MKTKTNLTQIVLLITTLSLTIDGYSAAQIDPGLISFAHTDTSGEAQIKSTRVIALMDISFLAGSAPNRYDWVKVPQYLKFLSYQSWQKVESYLKAAPQVQNQVKILKGFWINSSFVAQVTPAGLKLLAQAPGVTKIYMDRKISAEPYRRKAGGSGFLDGQTTGYDFKEIGLDKLISEFPDLDGRGVILGHIDTGVDASHPALSGKVISFFDAASKTMIAPKDAGEHGTHTAGTMVGGNRTDNRIGMAPGARLQSALGLEGDDVYSSEIAAMEHLIDPDKNGTTPDFPRAVNNSWNCSGAPDLELFYRAITAWEAAGILPVFSAGNSGPAAKSITPPHEHPLAFAIAASGQSGKITSFSSRGPGLFNGKETQKPDITAPGEAINSSIPGGGYSKMNGTSMAAPHVAGASALLFQINPKLTPPQVREIFVRSATPLTEDGSAGIAGQWNAVYGYGKMDLYQAVQLARATVKLSQGNRFFISSPLEIDAGFIAPQSRHWAFSAQDFKYQGATSDVGMVAFDRVWK